MRLVRSRLADRAHRRSDAGGLCVSDHRHELSHGKRHFLPDGHQRDGRRSIERQLAAPGIEDETRAQLERSRALTPRQILRYLEDYRDMHLPRPRQQLVAHALGSCLPGSADPEDFVGPRPPRAHRGRGLP